MKTLKPYMFVITAVPTTDNPNFQKVFSAEVHIWVIADSIETAQNVALEDIKAHGWIPQEVQYAFDSTPEQIRNLGTDEAWLYQRALKHGIASDYIGSPVQENPGTPVKAIRND